MGTSQPQTACWGHHFLLPAQGEAEKRRGAHGRPGSEQSEDFTSLESLAEQPVAVLASVVGKSSDGVHTVVVVVIHLV
jgi:hypothetical protein